MSRNKVSGSLSKVKEIYSATNKASHNKTKINFAESQYDQDSFENDNTSTSYQKSTNK